MNLHMSAPSLATGQVYLHVAIHPGIQKKTRVQCIYVNIYKKSSIIYKYPPRETITNIPPNRKLGKSSTQKGFWEGMAVSSQEGHSIYI